MIIICVALAGKTRVKSAAPVSSFSDALGAQPPLGFFDPLGLLTDADQDRFDRLRYVEVKHGRISMVSTIIIINIIIIYFHSHNDCYYQ